MTGRDQDPHEHLPLGPVAPVASNLLQFNATTGRWEGVASLTASFINIVDAGNYYTGTTVELALQEAGSEIEVFAPVFDGGIIETIDIDVIEDGGAVKLQLQADGGGDLVVRFGSASYNLDCTSPVCEVTLTAGTDAAPQINYVYITESGGTLTLEKDTSSFPATSYAPVATVFVQTAASVATDGAMKVHGWTDHIGTEDDNGHFAHVNTKLRTLPAGWISGVAPSDLVVSNPDAYIAVTAGVIYQLHDQVMPAIDMQTPAPVFVLNDPTTPYKRITTFDDITQDASGGGINNKYMNLVLWGAVSENQSECKLFINLPTDVYTVEALAQADADQTAVYSFPAEFTGTAFLIARYTVQAKDSGAWSQSQKVDLRGLTPSSSAGGGGITDHAALFGLTTGDDHTQYTLVTELASNTSGQGASLIGIEDSATIYTATEVEAALAEVKLIADAAMPLTGGTFSGDVIFLDSDKILLGTGSDASLYFDSAKVILDTGGTDFNIQGNVLFDELINLKDNKLLYFGTGFDAYIYYTGTDMLINPKAVGGGWVKIQGDLSVDGIYYQGGNAGLTAADGGEKTWVDGNGATHTVEIRGGIIISWGIV